MSNLEITYRGFINRISEVNKKDILYKLSRHIIIILSVFVFTAFIIVLLEAIFQFSSEVRKISYYGFISALLATIAFNLILAFSDYNKKAHPKKINFYAKKIGSFFPDIKDNLLNAIQIYDYTKKQKKIFSNELVTESIHQVNKKTEGFDFTSTVSFKRNNFVTIFLVISILFFTSLFLIFPNVFQVSAYRLINYNYTFIENTLGIAYEVLPGDTEVSRGDNVDVTARIKFNDQNHTTDYLYLNTKELSAEGIELSSNQEKLSNSGINEFKTTIRNINTNTFYWFEYKGVRSKEYKINITNRPIIKITKITVYPPAYTRLPSRIIEGNEISTIAGSKVYVEIETSDELSKSFVQFSEGSPVEMEIKGKNSVGSFNAFKNGSFKVSVMKDFNGRELTNIKAEEYQLRIYPDEYPKISIIEPSAEVELRSEKEVIIRLRVSDDFGFTKMRLGYKLTKTKYGSTDKDFRFADIPIKNLDATGLEVPYVWNLSLLNLGTEDEVEYFTEVFDNDAVSGPKSSKSDVQKIILPSLESLLNKTEKTKEEIESSLKSAYEEAMELKQQLDEIKDKLERNPEELGLNDPQKNQELQNKIENIQNQFSATQQKLSELMNELQNSNQISRETLEKYMELQKLFNQIDSKELREALKKLREAMQNISKEQLQEALKNFKFDEENFRKSLEKTKELLQKILNEQKFGELTKKLDEIAKGQEELKNQTEKTDQNDNNKMNELSKTQEQLKKEFEEFQKQLKELSESMKKLKNDDITKELEKMLNEMQKKKLEQKMEESSKNLESRNKNKSHSQQKEISKELNQMNQNMQDLLAQMLQNENSKLMAKMQEILDKLQQMSDKQGELKDKSEGLDKNSDMSEFKENAQEQNQLSNQLSNTIEDIMSLSQQMAMTPQLGKLLGDAFNEMNKATQSLNSKDGKSANKSQGNAKESLDKAIEKFQSMCQQGQMPGKGSSLSQLLQMLQQMIARQQALNQQLGELGQSGNEGQYNQEQMGKMQKLAMEQETIRKNLQQLNEEFKKQQEIDGKKLLGNLDQIQKDMMEVIKDLQDNNLSPETKKRQEKILSRLLDFQLSAREKDFEQKRESRPGKNFDRSSPQEIVISRPNIIDGINQDALELQKENYNEDYEVLIQKYMEKLKQMAK
ncbi:MAG: DUF4175 family protein [Ignavibacteria bacterium]